MNILIILFTILIILFLFYQYNEYLHNKYYTEGKQIIEKLREKKSKDETFDSIKKYYINLDRSSERKESLENEFRYYNIKNYERIKACDSKDIENISYGKFDDIEFENKSYKKISLNEISCTCSHLKAIKKAYDDGEETAIIMEDDLKLTLIPYWLKNLKDILENLPEDLEVLQLGNQLYGKLDFWNFLKNREIKNNYKEIEIISRKIKRYSCAICYLISRKGMEKIVNNFFLNDKIVFFDYKKIDIKIDSSIFDFLESYSVIPSLFLTDSFEHDSTIVKNRNVYYQNLKLLEFYSNK